MLTYNTITTTSFTTRGHVKPKTICNLFIKFLFGARDINIHFAGETSAAAYVSIPYRRSYENSSSTKFKQSDNNQILDEPRISCVCVSVQPSVRSSVDLSVCERAKEWLLRALSKRWFISILFIFGLLLRPRTYNVPHSMFSWWPKKLYRLISFMFKCPNRISKSCINALSCIQNDKFRYRHLNRWHDKIETSHSYLMAEFLSVPKQKKNVKRVGSKSNQNHSHLDIPILLKIRLHTLKPHAWQPNHQRQCSKVNKRFIASGQRSRFIWAINQLQKKHTEHKETSKGKQK